VVSAHEFLETDGMRPLTQKLLQSEKVNTYTTEKTERGETVWRWGGFLVKWQ